jgi:hypothetical protein
MIVCEYPGAGATFGLVWALTCIGYAAGLALNRIPSPGGSSSQWGGYLMSYSLACAGILAILGSASAVTSLIRTVQGSVPVAAQACESLPDLYMNLGMKAFTLLGIMTGIGMGTALIPIIGPAIANIFSVVATVPGLALSVTLITAFTLMVFITIFGSLAVALAPLGIALLAVPGGKMKGIGSWLVAAAIVFATVGPYIPAFGLLACGAGDMNACDLGELTQPLSAGLFGDVFSLIGWLFNPQNNMIMMMWRFALGSLAGWGILMAASAALSKGMGGVAASLGFG